MSSLFKFNILASTVPFYENVDIREISSTVQKNYDDQERREILPSNGAIFLSTNVKRIFKNSFCN